MTTRQDRLARLLAIRRVRLRVAASSLARAATAVAATAATATRLGELRAEFRGQYGFAAGYAIKAAAATRAALYAAEVTQAIRLVDAEARRAVLQGDFRHRRAGVDAVARAVERASDDPKLVGS
ncbi:hypothetical protein [Polymorphobacter megasporae]|uniref:hypothetical protein n=1 Tax=Glacieibacterium megasporae TaxID=2835787 RepID=UPI001C1E36F7|nr:hypothetical protein [Polymorphobacter megasporae]UAJ09613.1 hypothetical protein KTC28_15050 [Polymorphobacter megasporae]